MGVGEAGISERLRENKQLRWIERVNQSFDGFGQPQCRADCESGTVARRRQRGGRCRRVVAKHYAATWRSPRHRRQNARSMLTVDHFDRSVVETTVSLRFRSGRWQRPRTSLSSTGAADQHHRRQRRQRRRRRGGHVIVRSPRIPDLTIVRPEPDFRKKQNTLPDVQRLDLAYVSCAAGPARPDGELKRRGDVGQQPQRHPGGSSRSAC